MEITFKQSLNIKNFQTLIKALDEDFGKPFKDTMEIWCDTSRKFDTYSYWEVYLIKMGRKTVGVCGLYNLKSMKDALWLGWFGIIPELRSKGIGEQVLTYLEAQCKEQGVSRLMSYVDQHGKPLKFYERNGFKVIGRVDAVVQQLGLDINEFEHPNDFVIEKILS